VKQLPSEVPLNSPSLVHGKSALRGEVSFFVLERGEVTHAELVREFGESDVEEVLTGLFDRELMDFARGPDGVYVYFLTPRATSRRR
jgi:hypothetical protein